MADDYRKLSREELEELAGEALPERAAMSLINANIAAPINAAVAANVLSDNSVAYAIELSERTFAATAALIGAATFALMSDIAARSGSSSPASVLSSSRVSAL
jgi:hypothetical protein